VDEGKGFYEQHKVKLGRVGDEFVEVLTGLKEDERVVTSGGLLIDAEAQISQSAQN
jgi:Cu(I)/Ag(I) efflux system membrane fusion protein